MNKYKRINKSIRLRNVKIRKKINKKNQTFLNRVTNRNVDNFNPYFLLPFLKGKYLMNLDVYIIECLDFLIENFQKTEDILTPGQNPEYHKIKQASLSLKWLKENYSIYTNNDSTEILEPHFKNIQQLFTADVFQTLWI